MWASGRLAMTVHSTLGPGCLESVYQNALIWELRESGFKAEAERPISVQYNRQIVGAFTADLLVNNSPIDPVAPRITTPLRFIFRQNEQN